MKCDNCKRRKAVVNLLHIDRNLCGECFCRYFERRVGRTVRNNRMFGKKDRIAVAVSGGKDSLVLLHLLNKFKYRPLAITIDEGIRGHSGAGLAKTVAFCKEREIPLYIASFKNEYGFAMDSVVRRLKAPPCSCCGVWRRSLLNRTARELGCTALATGHNLDDEAQMALMNFFRSELRRMARSGAVAGIVRDRRFVPRVKPLRECPEREVELYARLAGIRYFAGRCPYRDAALRNEARAMLAGMEKRHPGTKFAVLRTFDGLLPLLRNEYAADEKVGVCECGEPAAEGTCRACRMLAEVRR